MLTAAAGAGLGDAQIQAPAHLAGSSLGAGQGLACAIRAPRGAHLHDLLHKLVVDAGVHQDALRAGAVLPAALEGAPQRYGHGL